MTITDRVQGAFFDSDSDENTNKLIRLAPNAPPSKGPTRRQGRPWTHDEHDKFLHAMEMYPSGPWKSIAAFVGTRTTRQTMTHAQKYRQKIARWKRGTQANKTLSETSSPPASPQEAQDDLTSNSNTTDDSVEDAMFWQLLEDILVVTDGHQHCGVSMVSLLEDSQPFSSTAPFTPLMEHMHSDGYDTTSVTNYSHCESRVYL